MYQHGFSGALPLSWSELDSFNRRSTYDLEEWQNETIIEMSRAYCNWLQKGKDGACFSPWDDTSEEGLARHKQYMLDNAGKSLQRAKDEMNKPR